MSKALDSGKAFLEQVLAKLPESVRESAKTAFSAPEAADALTLLGDGALARSDYSRNMDEIKAKETQLTEDWEKLNEWYAPRKALVDKYPTLDAVEAEIAKLKGEPVIKPPTPAPAVPQVGMTKEELEAHLTQRDQGYANVLAYTTTLATKHLRDFNEVLDVSDLVAKATKNRQSLADAYQATFGEKLKAKADQEESVRIDKLVAEQLAVKLKERTDQPFPLRNASPSVLDVLESKDDSPSKHNLDSAVAEYERLQSTRG